MSLQLAGDKVLVWRWSKPWADVIVLERLASGPCLKWFDGWLSEDLVGGLGPVENLKVSTRHGCTP
jgi:hypothetical protein